MIEREAKAPTITVLERFAKALDIGPVRLLEESLSSPAIAPT